MIESLSVNKILGIWGDAMLLQSDYNHWETHVNALQSVINVTNIQREAGKRVGSFTNTEYVDICFMWTICSLHDFWPLHTFAFLNSPCVQFTTVLF